MLLPSNTPALTTHALEVTAKPAPTATPLGQAPGSTSGSNPVPPTRNNPRIETLKELLLLEAQRERMESQLFLVLERICALQRQAWGHLRTSPSLPIPRRKRMAPGELRKQVFEVLRSAGPQGLRVSQIAATLGVRSANLHAFFYSLRGRHPEVQKIASGHYRLCMGLLASSLDAPPSPPDSLRGPSRPVARRKIEPRTGTPRLKRKARTKRGEVSRRIADALKAAGSDGISVRQMASLLRLNYRNIHVWLSSTGKKNHPIERIGRGVYRLRSTPQNS